MTIEPDRLLDAGAEDTTEARFDRSLRPASLSEYIGQSTVKEQMAIFIEAARRSTIR